MITALKISLICITFYQCFQRGMILHTVCVFIHRISDKWFGKEKGEWIRKPICGCVICQSSLYTILLAPYFKLSLIEIPEMVLLTCGFNCIYYYICIKPFQNE